jgi:hypothetical protein
MAPNPALPIICNAPPTLWREVADKFVKVGFDVTIKSPSPVETDPTDCKAPKYRLGADMLFSLKVSFTVVRTGRFI